VTACEDGAVRVWDSHSGLALTEPLRHEKAVTDVCFDPEGDRVASASADGTVRVWEVPAVPMPVPSWWLDIADALAGQRFNQLGMVEPVSDGRMETWRTLFRSPDNKASPLQPTSQARQASPGFYTGWAEWFFDSRITRPSAPFSPVTLGDYTQQRIEADGIQNLREALRLAPTNAVAIAHLARRLMAAGIHRTSKEFIEAEFHLGRAERLAPDTIEVLWARADQLNRIGRVRESLVLMEQASSLNPVNPEFWDTYSVILEDGLGELEEALRMCSKAVQLDAAQRDPKTRWRSIFLLHRSRLLRKLNRPLEAAVQ